MPASCDQRLLVDAHFGAGLSADLDRILRAHLPGCASCRAHYDRHLLLARLDPRALSPMERLGRGLGIDPRPRPSTPWVSRPVRNGLGMAIAALALLMSPLRPRQIDEFIARSGGGPEDIDARVVWVGGPTDAGELTEIPSDAELAFAYANRTDRRYLMILSIDASKRIAWYYPAWTDPNTAPLSIPIESSPTLKELPEAIRQHHDGMQIHLMALFLKRPLTVVKVEENIANSADGRPHIDGALVWETDLRIRPP